TLVPQFKGKYSISPAVFSYFDPKEKKYKNLNSSDITINVLEGPSSSFSGLVTNKNENSNNIVLSENQFKFLNTNSELSSIKKIDFIFSNLFYTLISTPFFLIFLTVLFSRNIKKSNDQSLKSRRANVLAKKHLSEAKLNLENKDVFYISLEKALINFFKLKFSIQSSELSKEKIKELLIENKIDKAMVELFLKLIESCEYARYTPSSTNAIKKDYDNSVQLISEIDKQIT
ncbi:MAG: BatD protein, partial [Flavobacteriales bacterium]|nr:BatD protein [Flavobacteriales bacterium]